MAIGGAIKYQVKQGAQVSDSFILENVVPNTSQLLNQKVAIILGKALLWAVFDDDFSGDLLDDGFVTEVKTEFLAVNPSWKDGVNPVKKVPLQISGHEGTLYITELVEDEDNDENGDTVPAAVVQSRRDGEVRAIVSQLNHVTGIV